MNRLDIEAHVARARAMRSEATGELIFAAARGLRSLISALLVKLEHLIHHRPAAQN
jgi:hypothetical protein